MLYAIIAGLSVPLYSQTVVRKPYLQNVTQNSICVKWRTGEASNSRVIYGTEAGNLVCYASDTALSTEHKIILTGLVPNTKYYYAIGSLSAIVAGNDTGYYFITSPADGARARTRICIIGDTQIQGDAVLTDTRNSYYAYTAQVYTDLLLRVGDNAGNGCNDGQYQSVYFDIWDGLLKKTTSYLTFGNHEEYAGLEPNRDKTENGPADSIYPYFNMFTFPTNGEAGGVASGTEAYYSFDYNNLHVICLDSYYNNPDGVNHAQIQWLQDDLQANTKEWTIAFWHHWPYNSFNDAGKSMRDYAVPVLENYGVDLVIGGHCHTYARTYFMDSCYTFYCNPIIKDSGDGKEDSDGAYHKETGPHNGTVYLQAPGRPDGVATIFGSVLVNLFPLFGAIVVDIDTNRMDVKFMDKDGVIADYFTIIKDDPASVSLFGKKNNTAINLSAYPNPFNPSTIIRMNGAIPGTTQMLEICDIHGRLINKIQTNGRTLKNGLVWNALGCPSGVYIIKIYADGKIYSERMVLSK